MKKSGEKVNHLCFLLYVQKTPTPSRTTSECSSQSEPAGSKTGPGDPSVIVVERIQENTEQDSNQTQANTTDNQNKSESAKITETTDTGAENSEQKTDNQESEGKESKSESDTPSKTLEPSEGDVISADCIEEEDEEDESDDGDDDDDDDDDGWITPSNIKSVKAKMGGAELTKADVAVGCLTTDFAMQVSCLTVNAVTLQEIN